MDSLLSQCTSGGCGAKIGPGELAGVLKKLPLFEDPNLLVGYDTSDDAAVYRLNGDHAIVSTADFFSPMVDDPALFGRIAAANALSDVYAMGGEPLFALNLVCFPERMEISVLGEILKGGAEKVREAGAVLCGGHSIYDKEPKYGLAVTGRVAPGRIWRNNTPKTGDLLILTKPLGVGIVLAAQRCGYAAEEAVQKALSSMQRLNKYAAEILQGFPVNACTDVTGFGLLTHAREMAGEDTTAVLFPGEVPYIKEAYGYAEEYLLTAAAQRNRNHMAGAVDLGGISAALQEILFDPQTSGGLLVSIPSEVAQDALAALRKAEPLATVIGEIAPRGAVPVMLR